VNHRYAPGRTPGAVAAGFVTFLVGLCLPFGAVAVAGPPAGAGMLPVSPNDPTVEVSQDAPGFKPQRIGTRSAAHTWVFRNTGVLPLSMGEVTLERGHQGVYGVDDDGGRAAFSAVTDCPDTVLLPQAACRVDVTFAPLRPGQSTATLKVAHDGVSGAYVQGLQGDGTVGIYVAGAFGEVLPYGDAPTYGDLANVAIQSPILGIATTPSGAGYWLMEAAGRVHRFGDAADIGSSTLAPGEYAVSLEATPTGKGYWLATLKGGVRALGDAGYFGSAAGTLGPDVDLIGIAATPTALGYWLLDSAGGVHAFGDAGFFGSAASLPPRYPVTTLAPTPTGKGYWIVDAVGGVFAYGDATAFPRDSTYSAYGTDYALNDAVMSAETAPYGPGQGFVYVRQTGGFGAQGVYLGISPPAAYGYSGGKFQEGSFAVDLAFNVAPVWPSPQSGTVTRREGIDVRAPQEVCGLVVCVGPPAPPEAPAPPALPPGAPAPPALPDGNGPLMPEPVWRPGL
jgi:hypothetical protein